MDDNSAQNPQDNGLSVMYGQPFGNPKNAGKQYKEDKKKEDKKGEPSTSETSTSKDSEVEVKKEEVKIYPDYKNKPLENMREPSTPEASTTAERGKPSQGSELPDTTVSEHQTDLPVETVMLESKPEIEPVNSESDLPSTSPAIPSIGNGGASTTNLPADQPIDNVPATQGASDSQSDDDKPADDLATSVPEPPAERGQPLAEIEDLSQLESEQPFVSHIPATIPELEIKKEEPVLEEPPQPAPEIESLEEIENPPAEQDKQTAVEPIIPVTGSPEPSSAIEELIAVPEVPEKKDPIQIPEAPSLDEISKQVDELPVEEIQSEPVQSIPEVQPELEIDPAKAGMTIKDKLLQDSTPVEPVSEPVPQQETAVQDIQPETSVEPIIPPIETPQEAVSPVVDEQNPTEPQLITPKPTEEPMATTQTPPVLEPTPPPKQKKEKKLKKLNRSLQVAKIFGFLLLIGAIVLISIPSLPYLWYRISSTATSKETESISEPATEGNETSFTEVIEEDSEESNLPDFDATLPYYNTLSIPSIGVNGLIHEGDDPQASLEDGVWMVPELGNPEEKTTTILAAHRFGYITWTNEFRTKNTFYNLPKTEKGDTIEIVWNQRKYTYEIYKAEEGTAITDYEADLILYTCKLFNTPTRIFRYASRTN